MNTELIMRVREMERIFDEVSLAVRENGGDIPENPDVISRIRTLSYYMDSGLWLKDYEADERGELPPDMKRGVLSEDGLYNLLTDYDNFAKDK